MPYHEGLTYSRQDAFRVENDLRCKRVDIEDTDTAEKIAYRCQNAALIGEFPVCAEGRKDVFEKAQRILLNLCKEGNYEPKMLDWYILVLACVLTVQDIEETKLEDNDTEIWPPILKALNYEEISRKTGCNKQTVRNVICKVLEKADDNCFFTKNGKKYYNTLTVHALSPSQAYKNLFHILYSFYAENLNYSYEKGTSVAESFVSALCYRWERNEQPEKTMLRSNPLSSGIRELFISRPHYMEAVCDALLEKIDQIVQGNMSLLDEMNRWDVLLKKWYEEKSEAERCKLKKERKAATAGKAVYRKENIHPVFSWENHQLWLEIPRLVLPEIHERPILKVFQGDREIFQKKMSVYGNDLLLTAHHEPIALDRYADWRQPFQFSVSIQSGDTMIYHSGKELYRQYFCFSEDGNETKPVQDSCWLYLLVPQGAELLISGEEDDWLEQTDSNQSYRCIKLRAERVSSIRLNGDELMRSAESKASGIWPFILQNPVPNVTALEAGQQLPVYGQKPVLCIETRSRELAKNYQIIFNGHTEQLYPLLQGDGKSQIDLRCVPERPTRIQIKNFSNGGILFQRELVWIPDFFCEFEKEFYYDTEEDASLRCSWLHGGRKVEGRDAVNIRGSFALKRLGFLELRVQVPKLRAEISGKNALLLPDKIWYEALNHSFLTLHAPKHIPVHVFLGEKELRPNSAGSYEVGAEVFQMRHIKKNAVLWLKVGEGANADKRLLTKVFFQECFLTEPIKINRKFITVCWSPEQADFVGDEENAEFCLTITGQSGKYVYPSLNLRNRILWEPFPGGAGDYEYTISKKGRKQFFMQAPDVTVWHGRFSIAPQPEKRFAEKVLVLTESLDESGRWIPIRRNGAVIDDIRYEGMVPVGKEQIPEYSGIMSFETLNGLRCFSYRDTEKFEKINPVFFTVAEDCLRVYTEDAPTLMLNIKAYKCYGKGKGAQIYSRKDELSKAEQKEYLMFSDKFHYIERDEK